MEMQEQIEQNDYRFVGSDSNHNELVNLPFEFGTDFGYFVRMTYD